MLNLQSEIKQNEKDPSNRFHSSLPLLSIMLTELIFTNKKYLCSVESLITRNMSVSLTHGVFMRGWYIHFEKFA